MSRKRRTVRLQIRQRTAAPQAYAAPAGIELPGAPWRGWRIAAVAAGGLYVALTLHHVLAGSLEARAWSILVALGATLLHLPYLLLLALLGFGLVERVGFFRRGRLPSGAGRLPTELPTVCVQLPMFNEDAVARRVIEAAAAMDWPRDRLSLQVLDDSTDPGIRASVRETCERIAQSQGIECHWLHRQDRAGYKAGALEAGRLKTDAEYIAIFDADFVPPVDFLVRTMPHFYDADGRPDSGLALVQAQWGHLNDNESPLTEAQALWVDDHHTLQQSFRSASLQFVNFTGTAGVWKASTIESVGGWRSVSLVEDCELSVRALFAGWRTRFVRDIAVPAELPQTIAAYRLQQKRWTQGWAQLQRLHLGTLLARHRCSATRKAFLTYFMCISWQWPLWTLWIVLLPFLIANGLWLGAFGQDVALAIYLAPTLAFALYSGIVSTAYTRHRQQSHASGVVRRCLRIVPLLIVNTAMLPHHFCAFVEGLFGPLHAEFERTPKTASVTSDPVANRSAISRPQLPKATRPSKRAYQLFEAAFCLTQLAWMTFFLRSGQSLAALTAAWLLSCIVGLRLLPHAIRGFRNLRVVWTGAEERE